VTTDKQMTLSLRVRLRPFTGAVSNVFTLCCITQLNKESWWRSPNVTLSRYRG